MWQPQYWGRNISRQLKPANVNDCQAPEYYIAGSTIIYTGWWLAEVELHYYNKSRIQEAIYLVKLKAGISEGKSLRLYVSAYLLSKAAATR